MSRSLSADLRDGSNAVLRELDEADRLTFSRARVLPNGGPATRAKALFAVVLAYRAGPSQVWAPVLLDLLAGSILTRLRRLRAQPPVMDTEDVRQQLVAELLDAAAGMPLPENPSYLRRRLMARANQGARRWLEREVGRQRWQEPFDALVEERR